MAKAKRRKSNSKNILKDIILFVIIVALLIMSLAFMVSKLIAQQETLSQQEKDKKYYSAQRLQLEEEKAELENKLSKINSDEYIESIAREKLNMYYPSEKIYLDASSAP